MSTRTTAFIPAVLAFPLAAFFGLSSLIGVLQPGITYRYETRLWAAQGFGQDWVDLLIVVPLLIVSAILTLRGSTVFRIALGGTLVYALYSLILYTFAMHFNPLFLLYCGGLGISFYAVVSLIVSHRVEGSQAACSERTPVKSTAVFVILVGAVFYVLWLAEVVPALVGGRVPKSTIDAGLITNPVHVLDLSIVLPAFIIAGISLYRRGQLGLFLAPVMLMFGVVMDLALAGMVWSMNRTGLTEGGPPIGVFIGLAGASAFVLWRLVRGMPGEPHAPA